MNSSQTWRMCAKASTNLNNPTSLHFLIGAWKYGHCERKLESEAELPVLIIFDTLENLVY